MFGSNPHGFHITFDNGWTASVQWGPGNYCDHHWTQVPQFTQLDSSTAEVAAWDSKGKWHRFRTDNVKGYMKPRDVMKFLNMIQRKKVAATYDAGVTSDFNK